MSVICFLKQPYLISLADAEKSHHHTSVATCHVVWPATETGILDPIALRHRVEHGGSSLFVSARASAHASASGNRERTRLSPDYDRCVQGHPQSRRRARPLSWSYAQLSQGTRSFIFIKFLGDCPHSRLLTLETRSDTLKILAFSNKKIFETIVQKNDPFKRYLQNASKTILFFFNQRKM